MTVQSWAALKLPVALPSLRLARLALPVQQNKMVKLPL
jgi:hypothetical protein